MKVAHAAFAGVLPVGGGRTARDPNRIATSRGKVGPTLDTRSRLRLSDGSEQASRPTASIAPAR
jgi:hypothetical protein